MFELLVGVLLGVMFHRIYIDIRLRLLEKRIGDKIEKTLTEIRKNVIDSKIEFVDGVYYLYAKESNEFLAQGNTFDELEKAARSKYPDKLFNVPQSELNQLLKDSNGSK